MYANPCIMFFILFFQMERTNLKLLSSFAISVAFSYKFGFGV